MRVKLLTILARARKADGVGDKVDLPDAEAIELIKRGLAEPVRDIETETAVPQEGERAAARARGRASHPQSVERNRP